MIKVGFPLSSCLLACLTSLSSTVVHVESSSGNPRSTIATEKLHYLRERVEERWVATNGEHNDRRRRRRRQEDRNNGHQEDSRSGHLRYLQGADDPCQQATSSMYSINGFDLFTPSAYSQCAASLPVDVDNMLLHLVNLDDIFSQYHCFYDIAKDPENSDPISYQPELGNMIYGVGEGAVDLEAGILDIGQEIAVDNYASIMTFWEIETLFNQLYDGHVSMVDVEGSFYDYYFWAIPSRFQGMSNIDVITNYVLDENAMLQLFITFVNLNDGTEDTRSVDTVNGQLVHDFMIDLTMNPSIPNPNQSVGARMNNLISFGAIFRGFLFMASDPLDIPLPDSFLVTYQDGSSETFVTGIEASTAWYSWYTLLDDGALSFNRSLAEEYINQPGEQFDAFERAISDINEAVVSGVGDSRQHFSRHRRVRGIRKKITSPHGRRLRVNQEFNETNIDAYMLDDNVAVLKIGEFSDFPLVILEAWSYLLEEALVGGQTKLLIDLSSNGGGIVASAYTLLMCFFPEVDIQFFVDQWDVNWNVPMTKYLEALLPILVSLDEEFVNLPGQDFLERINNYTAADLEIYEIAAAGMVELCQDAADPFIMSDDGRCDQIRILQSNVTAFAQEPSVDTYFALFLSTFEAILEYSPWRTVLTDEEAGSLIEQGPVQRIRGGVPSNTTAKFNAIDLETLLLIQELVQNVTNTFGPNPFDEYIFVSNGESASSAAIVPYTAAQLYKNSESTGVTRKVTLCGYGGTGDPADMTLSSIPASVQGVHLENPIIGDIALSMLIDILPLSIESLDEIYDEALDYSLSVAIPPYFADTLPGMPVITFYDRSMEPGALPLQFVEIPLDEYIPTLYRDVTIDQPDDLDALYSEVIKLFTNETLATDPTSSPQPIDEPTDSPATDPPAIEAPSITPSDAPSDAPSDSPSDTPSDLPTDIPVTEPTTSNPPTGETTDPPATDRPTDSLTPVPQISTEAPAVNSPEPTQDPPTPTPTTSVLPTNQSTDPPATALPMDSLTTSPPTVSAPIVDTPSPTPEPSPFDDSPISEPPFETSEDIVEPPFIETSRDENDVV